MKKTKKKSIEEEKKIEGYIRKKEDWQLLWVLGVIVLIFVLFFGTYFIVQKMNRFEYAGVNWVIENHGGTKFYHGRFIAFRNPQLTHNLYLRNDPKENDVSFSGNFTYFGKDFFLSFSPEVDECRGDVPVATVTLASFLKSGVGVENLEPSTTDPQVHYSTGKNFADCNSIGGGIVIEIGESSVIQSEKNPYCYVISIENCTDIKPIEKFMIETLRAIKG
ncbi:MAG: hypothetical protein WC494_02435 [Candidatus Pacearchaeota archaeon]